MRSQLAQYLLKMASEGVEKNNNSEPIQKANTIPAHVSLFVSGECHETFSTIAVCSITLCWCAGHSACLRLWLCLWFMIVDAQVVGCLLVGVSWFGWNAVLVSWCVGVLVCWGWHVSEMKRAGDLFPNHPKRKDRFCKTIAQCCQTFHTSKQTL